MRVPSGRPGATAGRFGLPGSTAAGRFGLAGSTAAGCFGLPVSTAAGRFADATASDAARRRVAGTARRCAHAGGGCAPEKPEPPVREVARGRGTY